MAKRPFAVFDVDGTQFKSACVEKVIDEGIRQGLFLASEFESAFAARRRWQINNNEGVYQSYLRHLVGGFVASMAGVDVQAFDAVTRTMIAEHRVRMFSYTANLARILKASHTLVAISGSPLVVVEPFLEGLGFDHVIGSTFQTKGGKFTGVAKSIDKAVALAEFAESDVDISVGIGDTVGDLPVLESAHCAIAFNPSATLRKTAIANGWFIVMEQKDAITQLLPTESGYEAVFDRSPSLILDRAGVVL